MKAWKRYIIWTLVVLGLWACERDPFMGATVRPDHRFEVILPEPVTREQLFAQVAPLAKQFGLANNRDNFPDDRISFSWRDEALPVYLQDKLNVYFPNDLPEGGQRTPAENKEMPKQFLVIFWQDDLADFELEHWQEYLHWRDKLLPELFPEAQINELRHPARFTAPEDILAFGEATGMEIPEKYRKRALEAESKR